MKKNNYKYTGIVNVAEQKTFKGKFFKIFCLILLLCVSFIALLPILWAFLASFKSVDEFITVPPTIFPKNFYWSNFTELFTKYRIQKYVFNSIILILGALVVEISFSAIAGYVISKIKPIGWKILYTLILWTMMMPATLLMVPLFMKFIDFPLLHINLMDSYIPMWIMAGANCFHIMMFKDFFDGIPTSYIEAARVDGAGKIAIFAKIILPLSKPIIATLSVFVITAQWNSFIWPYLLIKNKDMYTVALASYRLQSDVTVTQGLLIGFVMIIPLVIVYFISQKFVLDNDNAAGEKG